MDVAMCAGCRAAVFGGEWRRERDSNPRGGISAYTISNRAPSAARTSLRSRIGLPRGRGPGNAGRDAQDTRREPARLLRLVVLGHRVERERQGPARGPPAAAPRLRARRARAGAIRLLPAPHQVEDARAPPGELRAR